MLRSSRVFPVIACALGLATAPLAQSGFELTSGAAADPALSNHGTDTALWLPGIASDFQFVAGGSFVEDSTTGRAVVKGEAVSASTGYRLAMFFEFWDRSAPGDSNYPPSGSPKLDGLTSGAFASNGGPIDPSTWVYYRSMDGQLIGLGALDGLKIDLDRRGPAFQVGVGANLRNANRGGSTWFNLNLLSQPFSGPHLSVNHGDLNVDFGSGDFEQCVLPVAPNSNYAQCGDVHNFWVENGYSPQDFVFLAGGSLIERADGTATLSGRIGRLSNLREAFDVEVAFGGRVDPTDANYPPAGSPKLDCLSTSALVQNGGPVDTDSWHYYTTVQGTLEGLFDYAGAEVSIGRRGPAVQVGHGADLKSIEYGLSNWLDLQVITPPTTGTNLPVFQHGDFNLRLADDCRDLDQPCLPTSVTPSTLPTVTADCFRITGCDMQNVTGIRFNGQDYTSQDPCDLGRGYFELIDEHTLCFYPPNCLTPGCRGMRLIGVDGFQTGRFDVCLTDPTRPVMVCAPRHPVGKEQRLYLHDGDVPEPNLMFAVVSPSDRPSIMPGIIELGLGDNFTMYFCGIGFSDDCVEDSLGVIPEILRGRTLYFQTAVLNVSIPVLPVPVSDVCSTVYY